MIQAGIHAYRRTALEGATRGELLLALYDGALQYAHRAQRAIERRDAAAKGRIMDALMAVITELQTSLDHARAPELCSNLDRLYTYFNRRLLVASAKMDAEAVSEVHGHLSVLRSAWAEAVAVAAAAARQPEARG